MVGRFDNVNGDGDHGCGCVMVVVVGSRRMHGGDGGGAYLTRDGRRVVGGLAEAAAVPTEGKQPAKGDVGVVKWLQLSWGCRCA